MTKYQGLRKHLFIFGIAVKTLIEQGTVVAAGSDWPVTTNNPIEGIEIALTRQQLGDKDGLILNAKEKISLDEVITAYTIAGAYSNFTEEYSGSIEVGKLADFIVLDKNLFEIQPHEIHTAKVLWTVLEGKEVYRDEDWKY